MAEFLIKNFTGGGESPGDIVEVRPDGARYGRLELLPGKFIIVKVPGLSVEDSIPLMEAELDETDKAKPVIVNRRRFTIKDELGKFPEFDAGTTNQITVTLHKAWAGYLKDKAG